jgi:hypothetical protein
MAAEIIHVPARCINRVRRLREVPCQDLGAPHRAATL